MSAKIVYYRKEKINKKKAGFLILIGVLVLISSYSVMAIVPCRSASIHVNGHMPNFDACSEFKSDMVLFIDTYGNRSFFTFGGKSCIMKGSFSMPTSASDSEVDAKIKEECEKAFESDKNGE